MGVEITKKTLSLLISVEDDMFDQVHIWLGPTLNQERSDLKGMILVPYEAY